MRGFSNFDFMDLRNAAHVTGIDLQNIGAAFLKIGDDVPDGARLLTDRERNRELLLQTFEHFDIARQRRGLVAYSDQLPALLGAYIYGDYSTGRIWSVHHDGARPSKPQLAVDSQLNITDFGVNHAGELLVLDHRGEAQGAIYTLEPTPASADEPPPFPRKLSESGLFASVREHRLVEGVLPYSVNSPLWSDGAYKERFLAIPDQRPDSQPIEFTQQGGWNFPDGTVALKSFSLEMEEGNPRSRRWIETRFLTRQQGEWAGYSYLWNEDQTDANLVDAKGRDRIYQIRSAAASGGVRSQVWHYPSRTECMTCHTRAANWLLGVTTRQLNKDHDYGGASLNQLRVLESLGMFRIDWQREAEYQLNSSLRLHGLSEDELKIRVGEITAGRKTTPWPSSHLLPRLAHPEDQHASLEERARSYLYVNCASCHVFAGGGNAQFDLNFLTALPDTRLLDAQPLHHKFGLSDSRLIAPGAPERSVLLHRMRMRGPGQMPQLATSVVDESATTLIEAWIRSLKTNE